jgi:hypothetical protein
MKTIDLLKESLYREIFSEIQTQRKQAVDEARAKFKITIAEPHWKDAIVDCVELNYSTEAIKEAIIFFHAPSKVEVENVFENFYNISSSGYLI